MEEIKRSGFHSKGHSIKAMKKHDLRNFLYQLIGSFKRVLERLIEESVLIKVHGTDLVGIKTNIYTNTQCRSSIHGINLLSVKCSRNKATYYPDIIHYDQPRYEHLRQSPHETSATMKNLCAASELEIQDE